MGEPMPGWMREYIKLANRRDQLRLKSDTKSKRQLEEVLSKIRAMMPKK